MDSNIFLNLTYLARCCAPQRAAVDGVGGSLTFRSAGRLARRLKMVPNHASKGSNDDESLLERWIMRRKRWWASFRKLPRGTDDAFWQRASVQRREEGGRKRRKRR